MIMLHNNITRVLCALLLCTGCFMFAGCTDDPLGGGENTEQEGGESSGDNQKPSGPVVPISIEVDELTSTTVKFNMTLDAKGMAEYQEAGLIFSAIDDLDMASEGVTTFQLNRESYSKVFTGLKYNTTYYYTYYLKQNGLYIYGQILTFHTSDVVVDLTLDEALLTATSARINGAVAGLSDADKSLIEVGMLYSSEEGKAENGQGIKLTASEISSDNAVSFDLLELTSGTTYYYCSYVKQGDSYVYGKVKTFVAGSVLLNLSDAGSITATTAQISGTVTGLADADKSLIEVGMFYSSEEGKAESGQGIKLTASEISSDNAVSFDLLELTSGTTYYYCSYVKQGDSYVYGEVKTFVAGSVSLNLSDAGSITATTAQISGTVTGLSDADKSLIEVGMFYSSEEGKVENGQGIKLTASEISSDNAVSFDLSKLTFGTTYYYCSYVKQGDSYVYGVVKTFVAGSVSLNLSDAGSITATTAQISGTVTGLSDADKSLIEVGMFYSSEEGKVENGQGIKLTASEISSDNAVSFDLSKLTFGTTYYYCSYVKQGDSYVYGVVKTFTTKQPIAPSGYTNLSAAATANCYIVSQSGSYCLLVAKGNQPSNLLGLTEYASVLWESFGTSTTPSVGDLIKSVSYKDGYITFQTADTFKEGNAVIAAKDASGNILWSWHIWLTDQPEGQEYYNNAGIMMDRNLGATSVTPGDAGAFGLLYQWGRKDPFLGVSLISPRIVAKSTITWPPEVSTNSRNGTIAFATANPTTFITNNNSNSDWYYTGSSSTDNARWTTSESAKSIYDPCPAGWRVPDGGSNGVWSKALGSGSSFVYTYNSSHEGMNFSGKFGSASAIWYPASGYRGGSANGLNGVGIVGYCWSASPNSYYAYYLGFDDDGNVNPSYYSSRAHGLSVRCLQE